MALDDKLYLIYDEVEEIRDGLVIACNNEHGIHEWLHGTYKDIHIYYNNEIIYEYTHAEYSITADYLMIHDRGVYTISDIIHVDTLNSLRTVNKYKSNKILLTSFEKEEGLITIVMRDEQGEFKKLILSKDMRVLNSEFSIIKDIKINGNTCEFKAHRKKGDEYKAFKTLAVRVDVKAGRIISCRHTDIFLDTILVVPLVILIGVDTILRKLGRRGIGGLRM